LKVVTTTPISITYSLTKKGVELSLALEPIEK